MNAGKYLLVIVFILFAGLLGGAFMGLFGGAIGSELAQFGLVPKPFREHAIAWKGLEIVDNRGKQRALLDKYGLTFFDEDGEETAKLGGGTLSLDDRSTNSRVTVSPGGTHVIEFSRVTEHRSPQVFMMAPELRPDEMPKLGIYHQDGKVVWEVPGEVRCPTLTPEAVTLTTVLPLVEQLNSTEKLQLIEHVARELSTTTTAQY